MDDNASSWSQSVFCQITSMHSRSQAAPPSSPIQIDEVLRHVRSQPGVPPGMPFRVLVMGRANSGKTTILRRVGGAEDPLVRRFDQAPPIDKKAKTTNDVLLYSQHPFFAGKRDDVIVPTMERGLSFIDDEMLFPDTCPGFVFHDSRGMESGSDDELQIVRDFIAGRAKTTDLRLQLHAIWYCLPTDTDRSLMDAEMQFFDSNLGVHNVPVIALFTKFDAQHKKAFNLLRSQGVSPKDAIRQAPSRARKFFEEELRPRVQQTKYPPSRCITLSDMHNSTKTDPCSELLHCTALAVAGEALKLLASTAQKNSILLCIMYSSRWWRRWNPYGSKSIAYLVQYLVAWFCVATFSTDEISIELDSLLRWVATDKNDRTDDKVLPLIARITKKVMDTRDGIGNHKYEYWDPSNFHAGWTLAGSMPRTDAEHDVVANIMVLTAKTLIILERASWEKGLLATKINIALRSFDRSASRISDAIDLAVSGGFKEQTTEEQRVKWLYGVVCKNLLRH